MCIRDRALAACAAFRQGCCGCLLPAYRGGPEPALRAGPLPCPAAAGRCLAAAPAPWAHRPPVARWSLAVRPCGHALDAPGRRRACQLGGRPVPLVSVAWLWLRLFLQAAPGRAGPLS
eukprot:14643691-Alexandrium_andersonii.AAC.1